MVNYKPAMDELAQTAPPANSADAAKLFKNQETLRKLTKNIESTIGESALKTTDDTQALFKKYLKPAGGKPEDVITDADLDDLMIALKKADAALDALPTPAQVKAAEAVLERAAAGGMDLIKIDPKFGSIAWIRANKKTIAASLGVVGLATAAAVLFEKKNGKKFNITAIMDASSNNIFYTMLKIDSSETFTKNGTLSVEDTNSIPPIEYKEYPYSIEEVINKNRIIIITKQRVITPGTKGTMIYYTSFQDELNLASKELAANTIAPVLSTGTALATGTLQGTLEGLGLGGLGKGVSDMSSFIFDNIYWFVFGFCLIIGLYILKSLFF
jgi:hypothetical protein